MQTVTRLHRASFWGQALLVKMLITLEPYGSFRYKISLLVYFNIVQPLVCKTVMRLHLASFGRSSSFNENGHKCCMQMYFNIVQPLVC